VTRPAVRAMQVGIAALVVGGLILAWRSGVFAEVSDPSSLAQKLVAMGAGGYVAFIAAYTLLQPFGVPGTVFIVAAPLIWPWPVAFALSMVGTMSASVVGFSVARFLARDWIAARIPARFRKYDDALEHRGFRTVLLLRVVFWMPPLLHAFFGLSKVPFWTHFWGSFFGYIPPLLLVSYLGARIIDAHGHLGPQAVPAIGAMVAMSLLLVGAARVYQARG
jgi:uncharacterized membrane protein YdjX (TVP38/TMEM64 family)